MKIIGSVRNIQPEMFPVFSIVEQAFQDAGIEDVVMTSGWRAKGPGSVHPYGYAMDFDAEVELDQDKWQEIQREVAWRLGDEYDVLAHGPEMHLHVEWDPR